MTAADGYSATDDENINHLRSAATMTGEEVLPNMYRKLIGCHVVTMVWWLWDWAVTIEIRGLLRDQLGPCSRSKSGQEVQPVRHLVHDVHVNGIASPSRKGSKSFNVTFSVQPSFYNATLWLAPFGWADQAHSREPTSRSHHVLWKPESGDVTTSLEMSSPRSVKMGCHLDSTRNPLNRLGNVFWVSVTSVEKIRWPSFNGIFWRNWEMGAGGRDVLSDLHQKVKSVGSCMKLSQPSQEGDPSRPEQFHDDLNTLLHNQHFDRSEKSKDGVAGCDVTANAEVTTSAMFKKWRHGSWREWRRRPSWTPRRRPSSRSPLFGEVEKTTTALRMAPRRPRHGEIP